MVNTLNNFIDSVLAQGVTLYRTFAWRTTQDPYAILVSEVMLQQTQTTRVERYYATWLERFPTFDALSAASISDVLESWQGLGYNRRALALKRSADEVCEKHGGILPETAEELQTLPGIGMATAAGVLAFAFDRKALYLETNVRTVLLHEFFPDEDGVSDRELRHLLEQINERVSERGISARTWNYALLDYGAHLKKMLPNPSRRSRHHSRQSTYEGSRRQKRARILESILACPGQDSRELADRYAYDVSLTESILNDLTTEGFIESRDGSWYARK